MFETRSFDLCPIFWTKDYGHVGRVECLNARFVPLLVAALLKLVKLLTVGIPASQFTRARCKPGIRLAGSLGHSKDLRNEIYPCEATITSLSNGDQERDPDAVCRQVLSQRFGDCRGVVEAVAAGPDRDQKTIQVKMAIAYDGSSLDLG